MPFEKYLEFLSKIDVAIFNHKRQQAMGNITTLLGLGKTVYMRNESTLYVALLNMGFKILDIDNFNLSLISEIDKNHNIQLAKSIYSKENLKLQLSAMFSCEQ